MSIEDFFAKSYVQYDVANHLLESMTAAEKWSHVTILDYYAEKRTSLPALPASLKQLYCSHNLLTELPALPDSLESLYCIGNQLTTLPVLPSSLQILYCADNNLNSLPVLPKTLQFLQCKGNPGFLFEDLDGYTALEQKL